MMKNWRQMNKLLQQEDLPCPNEKRWPADDAVIVSRPQNIGAGKYGKESKPTRMDQR
jgi:hypothetical protein